MTSHVGSSDEVALAVGATADSIFSRPSLDRGKLAVSGFAGLGVPESLEGSGGTLSHAGIVATSAGRHRAPFGYLHQILAVHAACARGDLELVSRLNAWSDTGVLFFAYNDGGLASSPVPNSHREEALTLQAIDPDGSVARLSDHHPRVLKEWLDPNNVDLQPESLPLSSEAVWPEGIAVTNALASCTMLGLITGLLADTAAYVKERRQFGAPVGSFQAVKHRLADVHISLQHSAALTRGALAAIDSGNPDGQRLAALAKLSADATALTGDRCLQAMGGIGFTWEAPTHSYLKPALRLRQWPLAHQRLRATVRPQTADGLQKRLPSPTPPPGTGQGGWSTDGDQLGE